MTRKLQITLACMFVLGNGGLIVLQTSELFAQTPAPSAAPTAGAGTSAQVPGGQGGPGRRQKPPFDFNDNIGWTSMFNGHDLSEWIGDKQIWSVKDGAIFAESTCVKPTGTVYIDWNTDRNVGDFDMKFETLATEGVNGGVQYRSWIRDTPGKPTRPPRPAPAPVGTAAPGAASGGAPGAGGGGRPQGPSFGSPAASAADRGGRASGPVVFAPACNGTAGPGPDPKVSVDPYYLDGPQFDYDGMGRVAGNFYDQGGRGTVANAGEVMIDESNVAPQLINRFADQATVQSWWKAGEWNQMFLSVRGHTYLQFINGHLASVMIDDEPTRYQATGMIGFEIESTGTVAMRNLYIRKF
jgi:hypothetical protein